MSTNIIAFVIVIGVLIFFHEFGHFLVARLFGVGVERFSLGFGPKLFGKTIGGTDYRVAAIPLGGYVKMVGEEQGSEIDPADIPRSFTHKKIYQKMLVVAAGPFFNIILAVLIYFGLFSMSAVYQLKPSFGRILRGSPAQTQGLRKGDLVLSIDGKPVKTWNDMAAIVSGSKGRTLHFTLKRDGSVVRVDVTPALSTGKNSFGQSIKKYMIGVTQSGDSFARHFSIGEAAVQSIRQTYTVAYLTVESVVKIIEGTVSRKDLGGPIMIAQMAGREAREGVEDFLGFIAFLSVDIGILNFLPIPVLDGGHLFLYTIEAVIRRPLNTRMREVAQQIGIFILILLMIFVFYNDINRLISS